MNKEELLKAIESVPKIDSINPISAYNSINVEDLANAVDRFKKVPTYDELLKENQKYKEVIDKIDKYINDYNVFEVFSFPLMKRWEEEQVKSCIDYEFKTSLIKDLKDILKEVE